MKHLGDITKIHGYDLPSVSCVIGGSPCQDLSVAGKRAGLQGERSGLFMEQIRIIKEMRERDESYGWTGADVFPRFAVWENVPGALSSGKPKGSDFGAVLEEFIHVKEKDAPPVPIPPGGWPNAGILMGTGWSLAYRIHCASHWGVPQRRRRISLIVDFGGDRAPELLFEPKSMPGDSEESGEEGQGTTGGTEAGSTGTVRPCTLQIRGGCDGGGKGALIQSEKTGALSTVQDKTLFESVGCDLYNGQVTGQVGVTLSTKGGAPVGSGPNVLEQRERVTAGFKPRNGAAAGIGYEQEKAPSLTTDGNYGILEYEEETTSTE